MKIKNNVLKSGVILMMGATLGSCSDFLELEPLNEIVLERFWNEESDIENIVAGCYSALQSGQVIDRMMAWGEYRSDNIIGGTNVQSNASLVNIFKENLNASNGYTTWGAFYDIINRCNTVIYYAPSVADRDPNYTQSELQATIAEVSAIRDLCYFYLIRTFRDVPYSTEAFQDDTQRMDLPATPFNAVLDSLILDLERVEPFAVRKYPETKPLYQFGRITQDAIHAMLCDMYLWKQDYQNSVKYADMLIEAKLKEYDYRQMNALGSSSVEKLIDGFPLISDAPTSGNEYGKAYEAIFGKGTSTESIFELIFTNDRSMPSNGSISGAYGNETTFPGVVKAADFIGSDVTDEIYAVYMDKYDTRYYENLQKRGSDYGICKYAVQRVTIDPTKSDAEKTRYGSLWPSNYCYSNWIIYRLSDVMLMKAEALVQMVDNNDSTEVGKARNDTLLRQAYTIVNAINKRSNCATNVKDLDYNKYSLKSDMYDLVMQERQRELMFEGKRWFDLVRRSRRDGNTNYLVTQVSRKGSGDGSGALQSKLARMDAIYWPYNYDELKVNTNLVQNPAFGSGQNSSYENSTK